MYPFVGLGFAHPATLHIRFRSLFPNYPYLNTSSSHRASGASILSPSSLVSQVFSGLFSYLKSTLYVTPPPHTPKCLEEQHIDRKPRKKALLIGVNSYTDPPEDQTWPCWEDETEECVLSPVEDSSDDDEGRSRSYGRLNGPHNDVGAMRDLLIQLYGYEEENITVMLDRDDIPAKFQPTKKNIIRCLRELVKGARAGDRFFFQFAGHSTQQECPDPEEEEDGMDEYICTLDGDLIRDNLLKKLLIDPLPFGTSLTALLDSCSSGTLLDLPHHHCNGPFKLEQNSPSAAPERKVAVPCDGLCRLRRGCAPSGRNVICISAAMDSQKAWESKTSSMTQLLIKILSKEKHPNLHYLRQKLTKKVSKFCRLLRSHWKPKWPYELEDMYQNPQISSLEPLDMGATRWDP